MSGLSLNLSAFSSWPTIPLHDSCPLVFLPAGPRLFFQESFEILDPMSQLEKKSKHYCFSILGPFKRKKKTLLLDFRVHVIPASQLNTIHQLTGNKLAQ